MDKNFLKLNVLNSYKIAFKLSNYVWSIVVKWDYLAKDTVGKQFIRSIDSISANIAEGFGMFGKKDKINFYRYSSGSTKEPLDWNEKAEEYKYILNELQKLPRVINHLIKFTREKLTI